MQVLFRDYNFAMWFFLLLQLLVVNIGIKICLHLLQLLVDDQFFILCLQVLNFLVKAPDRHAQLIFVSVDELCLVIDGVCDVHYLD